LCALALDVRAVAEGVENAGQARLLRHLGYHAAQAYLHSRPLRAPEQPTFIAPRLTSTPSTAHRS
jgi:EAL domain-containing protein (putative c-di-GMP-specific phosphodiesterase class I)